MKPYYERGGITIYHGDCREILPQLEAGSVDLVLMPSDRNSLTRKRVSVKLLRTRVREDAPEYEVDLTGKEKSSSDLNYPNSSGRDRRRRSRCYTRAYAWEQLRMLRFYGPDAVINKHGLERVTAAIEWVRACPGLKRPGAIVQRMLDSGDPIPLPPPAPQKKRSAFDRYRHLIRRAE